MIWSYTEKPRVEWKKWFAWKPVPIGRYPLQDGQIMVWLEWVERKWLSFEYTDSYEHRLIVKGN